MLICSFVNPSMNLVNCLSSLFWLNRWGYGTGALGSAVTACFSVSFFPSSVSASFSSWGYSLGLGSSELNYSTTSVPSSLTTSGGFRVVSSLPLLNVIALTCSLPSPLGLFFELLGKEPCYLSVSILAICPMYTSRFLNCATCLFNWVAWFFIFAFVSFIKAV